jgi:hypothetical protein
MNKDLRAVGHVLVGYRWNLDKLKQIYDRLHKQVGSSTMYDKIARDVEALWDIIDNAEAALGNEDVDKIIDTYLSLPSNSVIIDNNAMRPVNVYCGDTLVGIARNADAVLSVLRQIKEKKLSGYSMMFRNERIEITNKGKLAHSPSNETQLFTPELETLLKAVSQDTKRQVYKCRTKQ